MFIKILAVYGPKDKVKDRGLIQKVMLQMHKDMENSFSGYC